MATGDARYLSLVYRRRAAAVERGAEVAMASTLKEARAVAVEYSSAVAYNPRIDRTRPYATRAPHPPLPAHFINVQTGRFRAGWRTRVERTASAVVGELYNAAPHARFMFGTSRMIPRPILAAVQEKVRETLLKRSHEGVVKALESGG